MRYWNRAIDYIDGLVQECSNSFANPLELINLIPHALTRQRR